MLRSSIPCVVRTFGSVLVVLLLVGCGGNPDEPPNPYHLTTDIKGDPSIERTRVEREVEEVAALSSGEEYTLYTPNALEIGSDGRVYVFDYGNNQIKAFTRDGEYLRTYGKGEGRGPGQMITMLDVGVWQDSLVYVVDGRQRRVLYFRHDTGVFIRHESYESGISRFARTGDSTTYAGVVGPKRPDFLRMTTRDGQQKMVSRPLSEEVSGLTLDGILQATEDRALYVFRYFPVILTYAPEDTTGVAYPTPDYGSVPMPQAQMKDGRPYRPPERLVHVHSSLHQGTLAVQRANVDSIEFDLYDADEMAYRHTVRLPIEQDLAVYGHGRVVVARDTTVHIYRVESSGT